MRTDGTFPGARTLFVRPRATRLHSMCPLLPASASGMSIFNSCPLA
jgi:hypothetical protein